MSFVDLDGRSNLLNQAPITAQASLLTLFPPNSFCGKVSSLAITPEFDSSLSATVTFEKESAAKTALLLDNTQLGSSQVTVTSAATPDQIAGSKVATQTDEPADGDEVAQEDKPRSRIAAEYLAHGYVLSDKAIQRALDLDKQHGISQRFTNALTQFDSKYKVSERAQATDKQYGVSERASQGYNILSSYFEQAVSTPTGQRLRDFYGQSQKQVLDVHNEAKHLAGFTSGKGVSSTVSPEEAEMEKVTVDGKEKTKCNCGGTDSKCPCEPGMCSCSGCTKAS